MPFEAGLHAITAAMPLTFAIEPADRAFADLANRDHWQSVALAADALGCGFDMPTALHNAAAGKYLLFTARQDGELVGSCGIYLRGQWAQEDLLFIAPIARGPDVARAFLAFGERVLRERLGIVEFRCLVANPAMQRFLRQAGYRAGKVQMIKQVTP